MKAKPILNQTRALIGLGVSAGILMASSCMVVSNDMGNKTITKKTVKNDRRLAAHNNNTVKIYPDMIGKTMHVVVKENKMVDFFVFDFRGNMIEHKRVQGREHMKLKGLARGKYIYRVFSGDEEKAFGQFEIK